MILYKHFVAVMCLLMLCLFSTAHASPPNLNQLSLQHISASTTWHRLLHYEPDSNASGYRSQVDDNVFFLAEEGRSSPAQELQTTLNAFYLTVENADQHAICRYPARWQFLQQALSLSGTPLSTKDCPELNQWLNTLKPHSVSLVFASSYLNSPSSMFGHTFLRIDPEDVDAGSKWLSYAVNFGAELNSEDNSILYAYKGLFGGYPGFFSVILYYEKIKEYSRIENRDLWEYNLNLNPEETRNLVLHLWELRNIDFDYYFFDENCSYRLLELLEFARPEVQLREEFSYRAIPIDTVRSVIDAGLVASVEYRPSVATEIEHQINKLNRNQQHTAWQLANQHIDLNHASVTKLAEQDRAQVIRVAYEHLRYLQLDQSRHTNTAQYSLDLLKALSKLDSKPTEPATPDISPDQGHDTMLAGITGGIHDSAGFADLRLRLSYHDLLDNPEGYLNGAAINIGELKLRQKEQDSLQIETFNIVDISSHSSRSLFFDPITWRVRAGLERVYSNSDDDLVAQVNGGAGVTYAVGNQSLLYTMFVARTEYNELLTQNWALAAGGLAGGLFYLPIGTMQLETSYYQFMDGHERYSHQLIHNIPFGHNNAVRLTAQHQKQLDTHIDEFSLELRHYF